MMRFEFDSKGYVSCILYGCTTGACVEYAGLVPNQPEEYADIDDWADRALIQAYYLNDQGNLTYDEKRAAQIPDEDFVEVKPYTAEQVQKLGIFDLIYPVGSLYMSMNDVNPAILFGGTWEKIEDRFLLAAGSNSAGDMGGAATYDLSIDAHNHTISTYNDVKFVSGAVTSGSYDIPITNTTSAAGKITEIIPIMPPYMAVYVWRRVEDPNPDNYLSFIDSTGATLLDKNANKFMVEVK